MKTLEEILADFKKGKLESFYQQVYGKLLLYASRQLGQHYSFLAEDCVQDAVCKAYQSYFSSLPRIASFIATSNKTDLLTDPTGSRRFICIKIDGEIDNSPVSHKQLYAELKYYIEHGERSWLTKDEEAELQEHNRSFHRESPQMELFRCCFSRGRKGCGEWLNINEDKIIAFSILGYMTCEN